MKNKLGIPEYGQHKGCFIAGGAILSKITKQEINDYDIYPKSQEDAVNIITDLIEDGLFVVAYSPKAITLKSNEMLSNGERQLVQVIIFDYFQNAQDIFNTFDFSVCMCAYDTDTEEYHFAENTILDIASRTITFNPNTRHPFNSSLRVDKYLKKGFYFPKTQMIKMAMAISNTTLPTSWEELETLIGGSYGRTMKLNRDNTPFSIDAAYALLDKMNGNISVYEQEFDDALDIMEYFDKSEHDVNLAIKILKNEPIDLIKLGNGDYHIYDTDARQIGTKFCGINDMMDETYIIHSNITFCGHKIVSFKNDKFVPRHYVNKEITEYKEDSIFDATISPYIFVFEGNKEQLPPNLKNPSIHEYIMEVEYNSDDIMSCRKHETTTRRIKTGKLTPLHKPVMVVKDEEYEDDDL